MEPNNNNNDNKNDRGEFLRGITFLSQLGITITACILVGVFLGRWLDDTFGTSPWLLLLFTFLGIAASFMSIFDMARRR
ncbi:MAG: AtpZ/AtpI family protein [Defluviitaleaceae bacterium]|nr:AtpZ/AtpI family protein [Defluviitaleaceae bacterium]MCL2836950.1 AtpZ/AtpI family protein [Defluviitaleaceae bacterium]